ncbi:hypothetical protein D3C80_1576520 [compost metagenome]
MFCVAFLAKRPVDFSDRRYGGELHLPPAGRRDPNKMSGGRMRSSAGALRLPGEDRLRMAGGWSGSSA